MTAIRQRRADTTPEVFRDREEAGRRLAAELQGYEAMQPVVLGLLRCGVPVASEVARALRAPLDVWAVRKVGVVPWHPDLGLGAVAEGGSVHVNHEIVGRAGMSPDRLAEMVADGQREIEERVRLLRGGRPRPDLRDRIVILVDDGIATGGTVRAVIRSIRLQAPKAIVLAVPVAAREALEAIAPEVERVVCLRTPAALDSVGLWYADFREVSDQDVARLLTEARDERERAARTPGNATI